MLRTTYRLVPYTGLGKIACLMGAVLGSPVSLAQDASNNEPQGVVDNRRETVTAESEATSWQVINGGILEIVDGGAATRVRADGSTSQVRVNGGEVT